MASDCSSYSTVTYHQPYPPSMQIPLDMIRPSQLPDGHNGHTRYQEIACVVIWELYDQISGYFHSW